MEFVFIIMNDSLTKKFAQDVCAASLAIPRAVDLQNAIAMMQAAEGRGWFTPDEDEAIRTHYAAYLAARSSLLEVIQAVAPQTADDFANKESFLISFAAATLVIRGTTFIVQLVKDSPVLWKKLDEAELRYGLPRKTYTALHKAATDTSRLRMYRKAAQYFMEHKAELYQLSNQPHYAALLALLEEDENVFHIQRWTIFLNRFFYRCFSFFRRNHSAYRKIMFTLFRWSGSAIAELTQPGIKPRGAPKRITPAQRSELLRIAQAGDIFITRHDDAVSNLFLPGFWPHAALYIGEQFIESKKDGVKIRPAEETLAVDALLILRPPCPATATQEAIQRALSHTGKGYDFLFDFSTADRLACTEVIYRSYHGHHGIHFTLIPKAGRMCIPAEALIDQALANHFTLICICNFTDGHTLYAEAALQELKKSRQAT